MSDPVVTVKQGDLRGAKVENVIGGSYISFKGIPYAIPPVGDLRFRDPLPAQPWTGVRDAITEGSKAAQSDAFVQEIVGDDDCLYLNVATTDLSGSRPVMVWIHGGGFISGDGGSDIYAPDYLMGSGVVFVGINYRLGVLGFLHLDHEVAPGNMGLKDQVVALKWVRDNIAQFGGNPNNVTIFGESAGGASVHYLLLSPLAKGLFHKAIMQSGVVLNPFASVPQTVDMAHRFVSSLGRDITDPNEIVEYLRTVPVQSLMKAQESLMTPEAGASLKLPFGPVVDEKSVEPIIPRPVKELIAESPDVPVIIGYTSHEGLIFKIFFDRDDNIYKKLDENFEIALPRSLVAKAPSKVSEIAREMRNFYFGDKPITKDRIDELIRYSGDIHFVVGIHEVVEVHRQKNSPTYLYRFSHDTPKTFTKIAFRVEGKGAMHSDELHYLFYATKFHEHIDMPPGSTDQVLRDRLVRMWTNFAKTGNPTLITDDLITEKWKPVTKSTKNYLEIDAELTAGVNPNEDSLQMWKRVCAIIDDQ